jgi:Skp family chaperone for outer membrane proteins|tara:strand:- start:860 stop:1387 length:528 start_codon:yes stop_codon:yes gene_type:complete
MYKNLRIFFFIFFSIFVCSNSNAENKILFVDLDFIFSNSIAGKKFESFFKKESKKINDELSKKKKNIDQEKDKLIKQKNILSKEEFEQKKISIDKEINEFNKLVTKNNNKLINSRKISKSDFSIQLTKVVQEYAKANSIQMIIKKQNVLIGQNKLDATNDILILVDKTIKSLKTE